MSTTSFDKPSLRIDQDLMLPDNDQWRFRFEVRSETSGNIYIVAQNIKKKHWGCSCPGYKRYRKCKHLQSMGIPTNEVPFEPRIIEV